MEARLLAPQNQGSDRSCRVQEVAFQLELQLESATEELQAGWLAEELLVVCEVDEDSTEGAGLSPIVASVTFSPLDF